jgi:hypothetical protein
MWPDPLTAVLDPSAKANKIDTQRGMRIGSTLSKFYTRNESSFLRVSREEPGIGSCCVRKVTLECKTNKDRRLTAEV